MCQFSFALFTVLTAFNRSAAGLTLQDNGGAFRNFQSFFPKPLMNLCRLHIAFLRHFGNGGTRMGADVFLYTLEVSLQCLPAGWAYAGTCYIVEYSAAFSAVFYIHVFRSFRLSGATTDFLRTVSENIFSLRPPPSVSLPEHPAYTRWCIYHR